MSRQVKGVVYEGENCMFASHMWWMLLCLGKKNVDIRDGGWPAWLAAGGAAETGVRSASVTEAQAVQSLEPRSEEHTSELQSLMRISYAVFCLKKKNNEPEQPRRRQSARNHGHIIQHLPESKHM